MKVFELTGGKKPIEVVSGIKWSTLETGSVKKEIAEISKGFNKDYAVHCPSDSGPGYVGLAASSEGAKAGQIPLALLVAMAIDKEKGPKNTISVFKLASDDDLYFYILRREGQIIADGDTCGTEDQIKSRLFDDLSVESWDAVNCPDHWRVESSVARSLESYLPEKDKSGFIKIPNAWSLTLVNVSAKNLAAKLLVMMLVIGGVFYGVHYYKDQQKKKALALVLQQRAAQEAQDKAAQIIPPVWLTSVTAPHFASVCFEAIQTAGLVVGNWQLSDIACDGLNLNLKWERSTPGALVSHFKIIKPMGVVDVSGIFASDQIELSMPKPADTTTAEQLPSVASRVELWGDLASRAGIQSIAKMPQKGMPGAQNTGLSWIAIEVEFKSILNPVYIAQMTDAPGFRLTKISGVRKNGLIQYQLNGIQYAKP